jgi:hypothetical protein
MTDPWAGCLSLDAPAGILVSLSAGRGGPRSIGRYGVGTLLLGGKTRAELDVPSPKGDAPAAPRVTAPRTQVARLPEPAEAPSSEH